MSRLSPSWSIVYATGWLDIQFELFAFVKILSEAGLLDLFQGLLGGLLGLGEQVRLDDGGYVAGDPVA